MFSRSSFLWLVLANITAPDLAIACKFGDLQVVSIPCATGLMTSPPRTQSCPYRSPPAWIIEPASIGFRNLASGTGGDVQVVPAEQQPNGARKAAVASALAIATSLAELHDWAGTASSLRIAVSLAEPASLVTSSVDVRVTLYPRNQPFPIICGPGNSMSACPHAHVPPTEIKLLCIGP